VSKSLKKIMRPIALVLAVLIQISLMPSNALAIGVPRTAPVADSVGSTTDAYLLGQTLRDGATLADGTVVQVGTSALLTPGVGDREIHTTYTSTTVYQAGTAVAPEGWTLYYSTDGGNNWQLTEPNPASSVTDIKAVATNVTAGLIDGFSQAYSTETTASVPTSSFNASSAGDGWGVTLMDNYVFNIYHHEDYLGLDCHLKSDSSSCYNDGQPRVIVGPDGENYRSGPRSNPIADALNGKLYFFTSPYGGNFDSQPGVLCIDVLDPGNPTNCGFTSLSLTLQPDYMGLSNLIKAGTKYFGTTGNGGTILCFDSATQAPCASNGTALTWGASNYYSSRMLIHSNKLYVMSESGVDCLNISDLSNCTSGTWPATGTNANSLVGMFLVHENTSGIVDGICSSTNCWKLDGTEATFTNPMQFVSAYADVWQDSLVTNHRAYIFDNGAMSVACFDYLTDNLCSGFNSQSYGYFTYQLVADPNNTNCIWYNSHSGTIGNFDATSGNFGCSENPVVTLEPSQFAPRYACSTLNGITAWNTLRISSLVGGGSASSIQLTVRDANGSPVTGWSNVPISLGVDLSMTGLDVALSGSRPTFSFAFVGVSGTISSATVALDYKGKGPELCSSVALTSGGASLPLSTQIIGSLVDDVAADSFASLRNLSIDTVNGTSLFNGTPSAPVNLAGSGLNTSANLTFEPPQDDGGSTVTGYLYSIDGGTSWLTPTSVLDNGDGTFTIPLTGLTAGQTYSMAVLAENVIGRGSYTGITLSVQLVEPGNIEDTPLDEGPIYVATVNSNNLPYTYTVSPGTVCTVTDNVITLVDEGLCTVTTDQAGDDTHIATTATSSFTVLPPAPVQTVPGAVENLEADGGNGQIDIIWDAPLSDGNSAITDYVIQYKVGSSYVPFVDGVSISTDGLITGLVNGTEYLIRVAAKNSIGQGPFGTPVSATPATVPGQPTNLSVNIAGTDATLTWQAPLSNGGSQIVDYRVFYKLRTSPTWVEHGSGTFGGTTAVVSGLDGVSEYDFKVQALNSAGNGAAVSTVDLQAAEGDGEVTLTWVAPLAGNPVNYIVDYGVVGSANWNSIDTQSTSLTYTVTGLTNGSVYDFRIIAMADQWTVQSYSSSIEVIPSGTPTAPTVSLVAGVNQITVSWTGATGNGSAITDYVIRYRANGSNVWRTASDGTGVNSEHVVTGLVNGTAYDFEVAAVNAIGTGTYSQTVQASPRGAPNAPTILTVVTTTTTADVAWVDPANNGGAAITNYVVQYKERAAAAWTIYVGNEFTGSSVVIRSLTPFTAYSFRVAAANDAGTGAYSSASAATTQGYTVVYLRAGASGGSVPATTTGGGRFTLPENSGQLTKNGFSFAGWVINGVAYTSGTQITVTKNTNVFARWLRCTMTYVAPTKTSGAVPSQNSGCVNRIVRANVGNLKRTGYYFSGWSINGTVYRPGQTISVEGRYNAIAQWSRFTITYMGARSTGGDAPAQTLGYGATTLAASEGTLVRQGYTFGGWILGRTLYQPGDSFQLVGNVRAFAKWIKNPRGNGNNNNPG
jgi:hypothetical protein